MAIASALLPEATIAGDSAISWPVAGRDDSVYAADVGALYWEILSKTPAMVPARHDGGLALAR